MFCFIQVEAEHSDLSNLLQNEDGSTEVLNNLFKMCRTADQTHFLRLCLDALKKKSVHSTVSASCPRGRGKSIVLGLSIAGAVALKYSNILISSLSYDNVKTVFKYVLKGLITMKYKVIKHFFLYIYIYNRDFVFS